MIAATILCEWFLCRIGEARADELARETRVVAKMARLSRELASAKKRLGKPKPKRRRRNLLAPIEVQRIHDNFKSLGWTYRGAAMELGTTFGHVHRVLSGERSSRRLLAKVSALLTSKEAAR